MEMMEFGKMKHFLSSFRGELGCGVSHQVQLLLPSISNCALCFIEMKGALEKMGKS